MFEAGKLPDELLDNFISLLENIDLKKNLGDANIYYTHAVSLRESLKFLRKLNLKNTDGGNLYLLFRGCIIFIFIV
jgi:hypothetical protein